ncbi:MAG: sigma-70 family RNA polymerase sigma factor [Planctomycetes bacterium]|nr:sigma-70 family RNA polymerase sigma factor [Planctomycetota bacterium]
MVFQSTDEEWILMSRVASGDESAISELYERFGALVFKASRQVLNSRAEAEDASQEIFVRLWKTADRFDPRRARLVTWVMLIARRHLIDRLRRKVARPEVLGLETENEAGFIPGGSTKEQVAPMEANPALSARIQELPALQREVIERTYLKGFTLREVSEQLNAPLGTVKSALSRGLARLRERMGDAEQHLA